jgi:hypothetical protein
MNNDWGDLAGKGFELFPISKKDRALAFIEEDRDLQAQLYAIRGALRRNMEVEAKVIEQIHNMDKEIDSYHQNNDDFDDHQMMHMEDFRGDLLQRSVYSDAAYSMSAVGMLAPFIESLFVVLFEALRKAEEPDTQIDPRRQTFQTLYWNPQLVIKKGEIGNDLIRGIQELAKFVGLEAFLPNGYDKTLTALFAYRNNMFHNGFEWPKDKVEKFQRRMQNKDWPAEWFQHSSKNDVPWIYYMSEEFIQHCLKLIDQMLDGVGEYLEERDA